MHQTVLKKINCGLNDFFQVGLFSGAAFIVGCMIGSGIFISPKGILRQTNSVGMSLVVWALCGVIATFGKEQNGFVVA